MKYTIVTALTLSPGGSPALRLITDASTSVAQWQKMAKFSGNIKNSVKICKAAKILAKKHQRHGPETPVWHC